MRCLECRVTRVRRLGLGREFLDGRDEMLLDGGCDERRGVATITGDFADGRGRDVSKVLAGHHEEGFDFGGHAAVRECHLEFVFEVAINANTADDDVRIFAAAEVDEQRVEHLDRDIRETGFRDIFCDHGKALGTGKHRARFGGGRGNGHDEMVVQFGGAADEVEVPTRHGVECAWIDRNFFCHNVSPVLL